jgi:hypothetical protein
MEAMRKWEDASNYLQSFVSTEPLTSGQEIEPIPYEEYRKASDDDVVAHREYIEKMDAYFRCTHQG